MPLSLDGTHRGFSPLMLSIRNYFSDMLNTPYTLVPVHGSAVLAELVAHFPMSHEILIHMGSLSSHTMTSFISGG